MLARWVPIFLGLGNTSDIATALGGFVDSKDLPFVNTFLDSLGAAIVDPDRVAKYGLTDERLSQLGDAL